MTKRNIENRLNELEDNADGTEQLRVVCTRDTRVNKDRVDMGTDGTTVEVEHD